MSVINGIALPDVRGAYKINEPLNRYTWLNVGGPADVMYFPEDEADLQNFMKQKNPQQNVFIIGGGSNLLVRNGGVDGFVIKLAAPSFAKWRIENGIFYCGAGRQNFSLRQIIVENSLGGLEFLCSIPGTLGGAMRSNAGCFGSEIADVLQTARIMTGKGEILTVQNRDFNFAYRYSDFPADWIVLEVGLQFVPKSKEEIEAQILQNAEYRRQHQPQGIKTAGSTFKNPQGNAAWKLIKAAGGDQIVCGKVRLSPQHCNFLQNDGTNAEDVEKLCCAVQNAVAEKCGINLEMEVKIIGRE